MIKKWDWWKKFGKIHTWPEIWPFWWFFRKRGQRRVGFSPWVSGNMGGFGPKKNFGPKPPILPETYGEKPTLRWPLFVKNHQNGHISGQVWIFLKIFSPISFFDHFLRIHNKFFVFGRKTKFEKIYGWTPQLCHRWDFNPPLFRENTKMAISRARRGFFRKFLHQYCF